MSAPCGKVSSCFECPYPDCIWDRKKAASLKKTEKKKAKARAYWREHYRKNHEKMLAYYREQYQKRKMKQEATNGKERT